MELAKFTKPALPVKWEYNSSVQKTKNNMYKWKNITEDMANELWIARELLSQKPTLRGRESSGTFVPVDKTWDSYCAEIGSCRRTVNRWLAQWFDESMASRMTGNSENYTPKNIIDKVREVLGEIDLDPASCDLAQETVQATKYYTKETDGLDKPWKGRIFLNPPYGAEIKQFTNKLIDELPNIESAILLTNDQTDTDWWQKCAKNASLIFMKDGRFNFYTSTNDKTSPMNGQTIFYYGKNSARFNSVFSEIEGIMVKVI